MAAAVSSGVRGLEAAVVVTEAAGADPTSAAAVHDITPDAPVIVTDPAGHPRD